MKEIDELNLPEDVRYTDDHEWGRLTGENLRIGITDYAQDQLGDIVYVELPEVGETFQKGEAFGSVESVKAVSEIFLPVSGEIMAVNTRLEDAPELVNSAPYTDGWFVELKLSDPAEFEALKDRQAYLEMLKGTIE